MTSWKSAIIVSLATTTAAFAFPSVSVAQEAETAEGTGQIIVTGKRAYRGDFQPLEVPAADQEISEVLLQDVAAIDLNDALDLSASVARQNNFGGLWNAFSIRGFSGDINLPSGFLVNGFNAGRGYGGPRDMSGIEAVEVLRGPRSALYGRGEPGGTVNLVTKRPEFTTGGFAAIQAGSFDFFRGEVDLQTNLGDSIGVRVAGFYEDSGSFREGWESERYGIYPSITAQLGENTRATYELEYTNQEMPFDRGVVYSPDFGFSPRRTFTGEPGPDPIHTDVLGHQFELQHDLSDNWTILTALGYRETTLEGNAWENNFAGRQTWLLDGETISRFFRYRDFTSDYFVARAELSGNFNTGSLGHSLIMGFDYDEFENNLFILRYRPPGIPAGTDTSTLDPETYLLIDAFNPVYGLYPVPNAGPNTDRSEFFDGFGVYLQDQIDITDALQIRIGGRFDDFGQELTNLRANPPATTESSDSRFSPQVGAVYRVDDCISLYASYGEGFRQQTGSDFEGNQFAPNITKAAELGMKIELGRYMQNGDGLITLALFQVDQSNILVNDDRPEAMAAGFFSFTAGEARSRGFEVDANISLDSGFNLWVSYAYTNAEFTNDTLDPDFGAQIRAGDPLINSPDHQLSVLASQEFGVGGMQAKVGSRLLYVSERSGFTGFDFDLPDYTVVGVFAEIEPIEGLKIRGDIENLFDETYYTGSFADVWVQPGAPTTARVSVRVDF